jgi:Sulfotransferase domain
MKRRIVRWNVSSRSRQLSGGDALLVSIPKSGRTWVRTFLCAYYCEKIGQPFTLEPEQYEGVPRIVYTHDLFEQRTKADRWDKVRGKYLIPLKERTRLPVVLLARDPRDAFVSLHVQLTRRTKETPLELKKKSISELLRDSAFGIASMVEVLNCWLAEWSGRKNFLLLRYEDLRRDPEPGFRQLLTLLGEEMINRVAFRKALEFSEFGQMQQMEAAGAFRSKILRPGAAADRETFKVRRGEVGGFATALSPADQELAAAEMSRLDSRFGYAPGSAAAGRAEPSA